MFKETVHALAACVVTLILCSVVYPAAVWGLGQLIFPHQAEGSLIYNRDRQVVGSELIGQPFASDKYFHPRPSAAGANGYDASAASGSNLGTKNPALRTRIVLDTARLLLARTGDAGLKEKLDALDALQAELATKNEIKEKSKDDEDAIARLGDKITEAQGALATVVEALAKTDASPVPADLVTASGGGLDPHISPEAAAYQAPIVAAARKLPLDRVQALIAAHTEHSGAIIGAPARVNVLKLNLALDEEKPGAAVVAPTPGNEVATLKTEVGAVANQLNQLRSQLAATTATLARDAAAREQTQTELKGLEEQLAKLADASQNVPQLVERVGKLDSRVEAASATLQKLLTQVGETRDALKKKSAKP